MSDEPWYAKRERLAARQMEELISMPLPKDDDELGDAGMFNPWEAFPLYGTYSSDFDEMAIEVLTEMKNSAGVKARRDLASQMFREMLCRMDLCTYGTSPRACFPTSRFESLLPTLIEKWKKYSELQWGKADV